MSVLSPQPPSEAVPVGPAIESVDVAAYRIPTETPESDGTLEWHATTLIVVEVAGGGRQGIGYTYADSSAARLVDRVLGPIVLGRDAWSTGEAWLAMAAAVRNLGRPGIAATAISAVDTALWDLKGRLLGLSLADLLGRVRDRVPAYGSGGFTSYDDDQLAGQLGGWAADGFGAVKLKVGRDPAADPHRLDVARSAIGPGVDLFVDANGAFTRRDALRAAEVYAAHDVTWLEEPVTSDDPEGLRFVRDHVAPGIAVAAGEYAWDPDAARRLLEAGAVDVLQLDATRCLGVTGFLTSAAAARAWQVPLSSHCAPSLHTHLMSVAMSGIHLEWFHDHARIEQWLFEGAPSPSGGSVAPDPGRPGLGLELRRADAAPFLAWRSA